MQLAALEIDEMVVVRVARGLRRLGRLADAGIPLGNQSVLLSGINDSIESPVAGNVGVGFAIPINAAKQLLSTLEGGANQ